MYISAPTEAGGGTGQRRHQPEVGATPYFYRVYVHTKYMLKVCVNTLNTCLYYVCTH